MYKKFFIVTALMLTLAAGLAVAGTQGTNSPKGHHGNWMLQRMTRELNLTEGQQTQIKSILQTERAKTQPIREQMRQNRLSRSSTTPGTFDENATRAYATKQAQLMSNLMVERERTKSQIFAVLTPDQQQKAQQLMQQRKERRHHRQPGTAQPQAQQSPS